MKLESINPSEYKCIGEIEISNEQDVREKVELANKAKSIWKKTPLKTRIELLRPIFDEFARRKEELAELESREMGMPLGDAIEDIDDTMSYVQWYFEHAEQYLGPEITYETDKEIHTVYHEPIGVTAVVIPWNFPFSMSVWAVLQGLIAGNVIVMKHSEECPLSGKFIENVFSDHHLPEGVFNEIYGGAEVGRILVHQSVDMIQFTGSTATGRFLYEVAGKRFLKANMELGGSAPGVIFEDADFGETLTTVCNLRLFNAGQCCDGLKRLLVHESIASQVEKELTNLFSRTVVGDALNPTTDVGPLVSKKQLERLVAQVQDALLQGAKILVGGKSLEEELGGAFYQPTLLKDVSSKMRVWQEEVFGPVLPIVTFSNEEEAIRLANDTLYGLGAYIFTGDTDRAQRVAHAIDSGVVGINGCSYFSPSSPFGGYKGSGFGREHGKYGFYEVTRTKVIATTK
uniref:Succinyl-CoA reductase n=1 Tax=Candidatus Kentrum sp. TUN TaxID=2126343 RepID=A0A451A5R2_9GAMM|nr:MAG: succinyl-CoA reductase [Candidatus Kentron sp. TUN]